MDKIFFAGLGGFIGSALRYVLSAMAYRFWGQDFPYGTLLVNIIGSFLIGFVTAWDHRVLLNTNLRLFLTIGVLGGFTTFSSFSYETIYLLRHGHFVLGAANVLFSVMLCLAATIVGAMMTKLA